MSIWVEKFAQVQKPGEDVDKASYDVFRFPRRIHPKIVECCVCKFGTKLVTLGSFLIFF